MVRFGAVTDQGLKEQNLPLTEANEKAFREGLRQRLGMDAYARKVTPQVKKLLADHPLVVLDGLYSWEEYLYLKQAFPGLILLAVYAKPPVRYARLSSRAVRPLQARLRDMAELENLNKGGPIALSDFLVQNNSTLDRFHGQLRSILNELKISR